MKIERLSKIYKTKYENVQALEEINLVLPKKGLVFIVGVSGSGKTTLMNMLSGVDVPTFGDVKIGEKSLFKGSKDEIFGYRNSYIGLVFQDYNLIEDLNVYDNIKLPYELLGYDDFSKVDEVIKKVDIEDIKYSKVNEISSGQMQRVAIARALIKDAAMILADEPTGNLDSKNEKIVFDLLKDISKERLVVVITHNDEIAHIYGDRIIEIEDGKIKGDSNERVVEEEKTPSFLPPKISFSQQARFTKGFIKNNLSRAISIFLVLLLVPIIGGILNAYFTYDIAVGYKKYQEKYDSQFLFLSQDYQGFDMYYTSDEYQEIVNKYRSSDFAEVVDATIDINPFDMEEDSFYRPTVDRIIYYTHDFLEITGRMPADEYEVAITDYLVEAIKYYQGTEDISTINIYGRTFDVVGIVNTNYEDFIDADFTDKYVKMAFEENMVAYNAIYTSPYGYLTIEENMEFYKETVRYTVYLDASMKEEVKFSDVIISRNPNVNVVYGSYATSSNEGMISTKMMEEMGWTYDNINNKENLTLLSYSKTRYSIKLKVVGVYDSDEASVVISSERFVTARNKMMRSRLLTTVDDPNYDEIVRNENITNPSYQYVKTMSEKAGGAKISIAEVLSFLIIIVIIFSLIINYMTVVNEKKKIGIKYSFGLKKLAVIVPYVLELVFFILVGFVLSSIVVKYIFPWVMKTVIYTKEVDLMAFDFFYISWWSILGWDAIIYILMFVNLIGMVLYICRKSPIEIIKDL